MSPKLRCSKISLAPVNVQPVFYDTGPAKGEKSAHLPLKLNQGQSV